jgi:RimJ/RimL family protein N-acetyltransferase
MLPTLRTPRLLLRQWKESDRAPWAALNADPAVMEHFPSRLTREESDARLDRFRARGDADGFGLWAVEAPGEAPFIGFVGLAVPTFTTAFTPCVEIGWRLAAAHWGKGYAQEAAREALRFGFDALKLDEIVSFTVPANTRSWRLMEKLGMRRDVGGEFDHPNVPDGSLLKRHLLYRLEKANWRR